jgi:50S ribosomal subunit-associated GTPase HflX
MEIMLTYTVEFISTLPSHIVAAYLAMLVHVSRKRKIVDGFAAAAGRLDGLLSKLERA